MNLLIEFLSAHGRYGAGEYLRRVVFSLLDRLKEEKRSDIQIYVLYDSKISISFEDMRENSFGEKYKIKYIDLQTKGLVEIIKDYKIDRFFIACGQRIGGYADITDIKCDVICVTHDMLYEEWYHNHLYEYWYLCSYEKIREFSQKSFIKKIIGKKYPYIFALKRIFDSYRHNWYEYSLSLMNNVVTMLKSNPNAKCIMVSEYSKTTMIYNYNISPDKIEVLYSPERIGIELHEINDKTLKALINSKNKYYLLVSADRESKNAKKTIKAYNRYRNFYKDVKLAIIGYSGEETDGLVKIDFLSDSDLAHAMKNAYALIYPSYFEGFGYPPLEAMKYGTPVLCTNTTSVPEILGNAPIYFSPLYESAIFDAMLKLRNYDYNKLSTLSFEQYNKIRYRQEKDLNRLIELLISPL